MSQKYCPECGEALAIQSKFCYHCGYKLPSALIESDATSNSDTTVIDESDTTSPRSEKETPQPKKKKKTNKKKKKKNYHIAYFIFLSIIIGILLWLIHKKSTLPEEKPLKSLPSERPKNAIDYSLVDSIENTDSIPGEEISLLSPELPKIQISTPQPPTNADDLLSDNYDDTDEEEVPQVEYNTPSKPTPTPSLSLNTEQSVRNILLSNRFVDPITTDVITFTNNGNVLMKNGESVTSEMEVVNISGNKATMNFYDDTNSSWDVVLDVSGSHKKLHMMDQEYTSDN